MEHAFLTFGVHFERGEPLVTADGKRVGTFAEVKAFIARCEAERSAPVLPAVGIKAANA